MAPKKEKRWYQSRTIRLAIIQAVATIIVALQMEFPTIAYLGILKSAVDIFLRADTTSRLK